MFRRYLLKHSRNSVLLSSSVLWLSSRKYDASACEEKEETLLVQNKTRTSRRSMDSALNDSCFSPTWDYN